MKAELLRRYVSFLCQLGTQGVIALHVVPDPIAEVPSGYGEVETVVLEASSIVRHPDSFKFAGKLVVEIATGLEAKGGVYKSLKKFVEEERSGHYHNIPPQRIYV